VITYRDQNGVVTTRYGVEFQERNHSAPSSQYYVPIKLTDGQTPHSVRYATRDDLLGGNDTLYGQGGNDDIYGGAGDDILVGGSFLAGTPDGDDRLDGGYGDDAIAGDNALITFRNDHLDPRMVVLRGTTIYGVTPGVDDGLPLVDFFMSGAPRYTDPYGGTKYDIQLLDHSTSTPSHLYGNDYIAGGPGNDLIFGQLGNDILQGDASILNLTDGDAAKLPVQAMRIPGGPLLVLVPSVEADTDGDDYIEGGGGDDLIFGNGGQDDIIGGSSDLFGLTTPDQRPDGSDLIFGGAGTRIGRNDLGDTSPGGHARDADVILGDNGRIVRLVGINGVSSGSYLTFAYDTYPGDGDAPSRVRIMPRAVSLLDYTPGGLDYSSDAVFDLGAADELHGEAGNDILYGMVGNDILYGGGQDDDLIGG
jgi:Ca2+-binding RTX toxin-like protein